jgi:phosphate:Na+ symporter
MLLQLGGGLALFLFGMELMSVALRRTAGDRLRRILSLLTHNRVVGVLAGAFITMLIQSSGATTVLLVSFVRAGLMSFAQTLGVILGADIGTTVTAQLIAFDLGELALPTIALGFILRYLPGRHSLRDVGDVLLGIGLLFFGLEVMSQAMVPLRSDDRFLEIVGTMRNPLLGIAVGAIATAAVQSSSAFTGIIIVLAQDGFLGLEQSLPLILGANVGSCITAALASIPGPREARRVALAHTVFKLLGVMLVLPFLGSYATLVRDASQAGVGAAGASVARQVANAHTIFNVGLTLVFLPVVGLMGRLIERLYPERVEVVEEVLHAQFLDRSMLRTPSLALSLAKVEVLRMGKTVKAMLDDVLTPLLEGETKALDAIHKQEEWVDAVQSEINNYLIKVGQRNLSEQQTREVYELQHVGKQFELIADVIDKQLRTLARKKLASDASFSSAGHDEIEAFHTKAVKQIARSLEALAEYDEEAARRVAMKQEKYDDLEEKYRRAHFDRLQAAVDESVASSGIHLDVMDSLQSINSYALSIARSVLALSKAAPEGPRSA